MGYDTSYRLEWEPLEERVQLTEGWVSLVDSVGEEKAAELVEKGLAVIQKSIRFDDLIAGWIAGNTEASFALEKGGGTRESAKWYDHEDDVTELSELYPWVLFTLYGEGENSDDQWRKYFLNGKVQVAKAQITFAPCTLAGLA